LTHYFQPEPNFFAALPFAKRLKEYGHQIQVLTGFPNYPGGKIYDGYKVKFLQREIMDGIPIVRVPIYPSHDRSSFKRIISYISLSLSQTLIGTFAIKSADISYVGQGPATIALPAIVIRIFRRIPYVVSVQDLWPDSLTATGMFDNRFGLYLVDLWCRLMYKCASKVIVPTPGIKSKLIQRNVKPEKIEVIYNWCDEDLIYRGGFDNSLTESLGMANKFNIVFAGNIGKAQALESSIDAAKILSSGYPNIQFVFFGGGVDVDFLKEKADKLKLKNVVFHERKPISEIGPILRLANVLFVHLRNDPLFAITIPSKVQAYMAIGRPILVGVKGDATELVERIGAGVACEPGNPQSIADAVIKLYSMTEQQRIQMGNKGMEFYDKEMSFGIAAKKYEKVFEAIVKK